MQRLSALLLTVGLGPLGCGAGTAPPPAAPIDAATLPFLSSDPRLRDAAIKVDQYRHTWAEVVRREFGPVGTSACRLPDERLEAMLDIDVEKATGAKISRLRAEIRAPDCGPDGPVGPTEIRATWNQERPSSGFGETSDPTVVDVVRRGSVDASGFVGEVETITRRLASYRLPAMIDEQQTQHQLMVGVVSRGTYSSWRPLKIKVPALHVSWTETDGTLEPDLTIAVWENDAQGALVTHWRNENQVEVYRVNGAVQLHGWHETNLRDGTVKRTCYIEGREVRTLDCP